jgi:hypothetical protein
MKRPPGNCSVVHRVCGCVCVRQVPQNTHVWVAKLDGNGFDKETWLDARVVRTSVPSVHIALMGWDWALGRRPRPDRERGLRIKFPFLPASQPDEQTFAHCAAAIGLLHASNFHSKSML